MRLRGKLVLVMSGLGGALVALVLVSVHLWFTRHTLNGAYEDIADSGTALRHALARNLESYRVLGHAVSDDTVVKEALVGGNQDLAFTYVDSVHDRTGADYLVLLDGAGKVITDRRQQQRSGQALPFATGAKTGFVVLDGHLVAAAVVPVTLGGRTIGSLLIGEALTRETLADIQTTSRSGVTFLVGGADPISTLAQSDVPVISRVTQTCSGSRKQTVEQIDIGGAPNLVAMQPLADIAGQPIGCVALTRSLAGAYAELRDLQRWLLGFGLLITALGVLVARVISARVVEPIGKLTAAARIVKEGDLTKKIEIRTRDEIGDLAQVFVELVERLRDIPTSLRRSVELLSKSVDNLSTVTHEQTAMIATQASALREMQATVHEIKQTSRMAAEKAAGVVRAADRVEELNQIGGKAIESTLGGINEVIGEVNGINEKISELGERARQIGMITETVKDLADQSNMLALNAAIEAVRSGEHGKGFSVVAREIRALADQSIEATTRARAILGEVTNAIRLAVARTDTGVQKMEAGLVQARASGNSMRELSEIVRDNFAAVRQIGAAVTQQDAGVAQMFGAVGDLSKMMDGIVERLDTTNRAVDDLRAATLEVTEIVRRFRE